MRVPKKVAKPAGAAAKPAARRKPAAEAQDAKPATKNMLVAGFRAITDAHQEALARQRGVFESLLGLGGPRESDAPSAERESPLATGAIDPFGFRKFEDVFDQRVARALERLEWPTPEAHTALRDEVDALRTRVAALEAAAKKR